MEEAEQAGRDALVRSLNLMQVFYDLRSSRQLAASTRRGFGEVLAAMGKLEQAEEQYRASLELQLAVLPTGMTPKARAYAFMSRKLDPLNDRLALEPTCDYAETQYQLGLVLQRMGKTDEADGWMSLAAALLCANNPTQALDALIRAQGLRGRSTRVELLLLALAHGQLAQCEKAQEFLRMADGLTESSEQEQVPPFYIARIEQDVTRLLE